MASRIIKKIKQRKEKEEKEPSEKKRKPSNRPDWFVYMLVLMSGPHAGKTYVGKTYDPEKRLKQHNSPNSKTIRTSRWTEKHKHQWEIVWVVSGFKMEEQALKFEWRCQHLKMGNFQGEPMQTAAYKYLVKAPTKRYQRHIKYLTRNMLISCCLNRWSSSLPLAKTLVSGLHISWYKSEFAPKNELGKFSTFENETCGYLPDNNFVTQDFLSKTQVLCKISKLSIKEVQLAKLEKVFKPETINDKNDVIDLTKI